MLTKLLRGARFASAGNDGQWAKVLSKLIDLFKKLPLKKITDHQAFDLFFDLLMLFAMGEALRADLSADRRLVLVVMCLFFIGSSFFVNRPVRRGRR